MTTPGRWTLAAVGIGSITLMTTTMLAQAPQAGSGASGRGRDQLNEPVYRVAAQQPGEPAAKVAANTGGPAAGAAPAVDQHPLIPALRMAKDSLAHIQADIRDYSCTMMKRERVNGKLNEAEFMFLKVRHEPF